MADPMNVEREIKEVTFEAVVTRADGTVENLGPVSYWHKSPLRRLLWRLTHRS
jgi:hypothetical protein